MCGASQRTPPTSGITQPPVLATAARHVLDGRARHARRPRHGWRRSIRTCWRNHRWWERRAIRERSGLVATLHPWETGMDNSPAWDAALARVPTETTTPVRRRDTAHVDPAFRPRDEDYQRFIHLVDLFRGASWRAERMLACTPFRVADVGTNAILLRAERDLLALAERFGSPADKAEIGARILRKTSALVRLWHADLGLFVSRDLLRGTAIETATSAGFLPLYARAASSDRCRAMGMTLDGWARRVGWLVPSTDPFDACFRADALLAWADLGNGELDDCRRFCRRWRDVTRRNDPLPYAAAD